MEGNGILIFLIIAGVIILTFMIFPKPLKLILRAILQGLGGLVGFFVLNFILSPIGWSVGINWTTMLIVGILGIPGFIFLYLLNIFL